MLAKKLQFYGLPKEVSRDCRTHHTLHDARAERSTSDILEGLAKANRPNQRQALLNELARQCTKEAEEYLIDQYHRATSSRRFSRLCVPSGF